METKESILFKLKRSSNAGLNADTLDGLESAVFTKLLTTTNVGTVNTGVTAVESGNAYEHTTVLTVSQTAALTLADNASLADGYLIYTFPAGAIVVNSAYMTMTVTNAEHDTEATDVGLGTVIASGAVAILGGTGTFEDVMTGQTAAVGTAEVKTVVSNFVIEAAAAHTLHFNAAAAWADTAGSALDADIAGSIVLNWSFLA